MDQETPSAMVRIGELGRRVGVSEHVLRAWERRYGLLRPERSPGGYRLYSAADERRVRRMQAQLAGGLSGGGAGAGGARGGEGKRAAGVRPAEAARAALSEERPGPPPPPGTGSADGGGLAGSAR